MAIKIKNFKRRLLYTVSAFLGLVLVLFSESSDFNLNPKETFADVPSPDGPIVSDAGGSSDTGPGGGGAGDQGGSSDGGCW